MSWTGVGIHVQVGEKVLLARVYLDLNCCHPELGVKMKIDPRQRIYTLTRVSKHPLACLDDTFPYDKDIVPRHVDFHVRGIV